MNELIVPIIVLSTILILIAIYVFRKKLPFVDSSSQYIQNDGPFFKFCRFVSLVLCIVILILIYVFQIDSNSLRLLALVLMFFSAIGSSSKKVKIQ